MKWRGSSPKSTHRGDGREHFFRRSRAGGHRCLFLLDERENVCQALPTARRWKANGDFLHNRRRTVFWCLPAKAETRPVGRLKDRLRSATIVPYDEGLCRTYAEIKTTMTSKGKTVSDNDFWIAACAVRHSIPLVTNNSKHFDEVPALVVISESQAMREMQSQISISEATPTRSKPTDPSS